MSRNHRAFTLIELFMVMAIIATLAAIGVPNFLEAQIRSKVVRTHQDMDVLEAALKAYYADYNAYPPTQPNVLEGMHVPWNSDAPVVRTLPPLPGVSATPTPTPTPTPSPYGGYGGYGFSPPDPLENPTLSSSGWALNVLTTPVAYLSNVLPVDLFAYKRHTPLGYVNLIEAREAFGLGDAGDTRRYYLFSASPGQADSPPNPLVQEVLPYDPTNGSVSRGTIARYGN